MVQAGSYVVWVVSKITGDNVDNLVRVSLKSEGRSDTIIDMPLENAPAIGSVVTLGWR